MSVVAIKSCNQYDLVLVKEKLRSLLDDLGGLDQYIQPNDRVFIKLNALAPFDPSYAITTHPVVVQAMIQLVKERTSNILIGDNPAIRDITHTLKKNGVYQIVQEENIPIFNGKESVTITNPTAIIYKEFQVSKQMMDVDVFINLPKLKTHALTYMTIAQKNLFGLIYGLTKASWHVKANNPLDFADALCDLYGAFTHHFKNKTILHICDGIIGLEGEGPSSAGNPKQAGVLLASTDAIALDRVAVEIAGLEPSKLLMNQIAHERGYGEGKLSSISLLGDSLHSFKDIRFVAPENLLSISAVRLLKHTFIKNLLFERPVFDGTLCVRCGECVKICPPNALSIKPNSIPSLDPSICIRCWCCAEVCPEHAISKSKRPLLGKILLKE